MKPYIASLLMLYVQTTDTQKPVHVPTHEVVVVFRCEYTQGEWSPWHQTRVCIGYKDKNGVKWVVTLSKNRQYAVLMTRNGEEVYFLPETPMVDI